MPVARTNWPSALDAGRVAARNLGEVEQDAGSRRLLRAPPEAVGQQVGVAEEDVSAQPATQEQMRPVRQQGTFGNGADARAPALANRELLRHDVSPPDADREQDQCREHSRGNALDEAERRDDDADQHDRAVVRPVQPPADADQPAVEQVDPDEQQDPSDDRHRQQFQHAAPEEQRDRQDGGDEDPEPRRVDAEHSARQGEDEGLAARRAAAGSGAQSGQSGDPELPVQVDVHAGRHLQAVRVHEQAEQGDQHHREDARNVRGGGKAKDETAGEEHDIRTIRRGAVRKGVRLQVGDDFRRTDVIANPPMRNAGLSVNGNHWQVSGRSSDVGSHMQPSVEVHHRRLMRMQGRLQRELGSLRNR